MSEIIVKKPDDSEKNALDLESWSPWGCPVSKFDWEYDANETCYIYEGRVIVTTDKGDTEIKKGDLVTFSRGLKCIWDVKEPIKKVYRFH